MTELPDWKLLQDSPRLFFKLTTHFTERDLKRSYNSWLRRFKPEQAPEEFKRIRAAYEFLLESLSHIEDPTLDRSHLNLPHRSKLANSLDPEEPELLVLGMPYRPLKQLTAPKDIEADRAIPMSAPSYLDPSSWHEADLTALHLSLVEREQKNSTEALALALLQDIVDSPSSSFEQALLSALREHPQNEGLSRLLHGWQQSCETLVSANSDIADKNQQASPYLSLPQLIECHELLYPECYFPATLAAWKAALRNESFAEFEAAHNELARLIEGDYSTSRLYFELELTIAAVYRGRIPWLAKQSQLLEDYHEALPEELHEELDLLQALLKHRMLREEQAAPAVLEPFDNLLQRFCEAPDHRFGSELIPQLRDFAKNPYPVFEQYNSATMEEAAKAVFLPLSCITLTIRDERFPQSTEQRATLDPAVAKGFVKRLATITKKSTVGKPMSTTEQLRGVFILLLATLPGIFTFIHLSTSLFHSVIIWGLTNLLLLPFLWSRQKKIFQKNARLSCDKICRAETAKLLAAHESKIFDLCQAAQQLENFEGSYIEYVLINLNEDPLFGIWEIARDLEC